MKDLTISHFLERCRRILPDNYILWCDVFSRKIKGDYETLSLYTKNVEFVKEYSNHLMIYFKQCAKKDWKEITVQLKIMLNSQHKEYIDHKIDAYCYFWMMGCYLKKFKDKDKDVNYYIALAKQASGQSDYRKADDAINHLIKLNRNKEADTLKRLSLVLTYRCNLRCKHCWIYDKDSFKGHRMERHVTRPEITLDEIDRMIKKSSLLQNTFITLTGGEPFLRKDLGEILCFFADAGIKVELFTNGTFPGFLRILLSDRKIRDSIRAVIFSFDGDRKTHDLIRGKGVFDKLVESIDILKSNNVKVRLNTVITEQNHKKLTEIAQAANKLGCHSHDFNVQTQDGRYWPIPDIKQIRPYLYANTYFRVLDEKKYIGHGCLAGITRCSITPDGLVEACSTSKAFNHFILGNLYDYNFDFDALWFSDTAQKIRYRIRNCPGCANHCERG